jgi:peptidoglycan/xylan/chitin deacetylase (PgdA/CDA1 family)
MNWLNKTKTKDGNDIYLITSWDDFGDYEYQIYELLKKYSIPAIFFIPVKELFIEKKRKLAHLIAKDFIIGSHTINHSELPHIPQSEMICEIKDSKTYLETIFKRQIDCFCYPRGRYNDLVKLEVKNAGYKMARTTDVSLTHLSNADMFALATTIHVYSGRKEYAGKTWLEMAINFFDYIIEYGGYFHLWGHGNEINRNKEWNNLEWFFSYIN